MEWLPVDSVTIEQSMKHYELKYMLISVASIIK